jgi:hypothetical protein
MDCRCGCGEPVKASRVYVDKFHQIAHLRAGEARRIGALEPLEARQRGGATAGRAAHESGRLADAARKGGERSREIAAEVRAAEDSRP